MKYIIDRFEGNFAIVELDDKTMVNIPLTALPKEAKEGDVISVTIDYDETGKRLREMKDKFNKLLDK